MAVDAKRVKSTRRSERAGATPTTAITIDRDTIAGDTASITLYGYDKPLNATCETVFASNRTDRDILELWITTVYLDTDNRQIHRASRHVKADIPAGETRVVNFPTWDTQRSFYYEGSRRPRVSATPYRVRQRVDTLIVKPLADKNDASSN